LAAKSLQEQIPHNHCFGCGPENETGLHLRSYWSGQGASIARFAPAPQHCAGPRHFVNGGIIGTLIDCHCICTATAAAYYDRGLAIGTPPYRYFATASMTLNYLRPAGIDTELVLSAEIMQQTDRGFVLSCTLNAADKLCVTASVTAVQVSESWMTASNNDKKHA
jgi:acyl-coenzyme A thioesterase PaaI-like protein